MTSFRQLEANRRNARNRRLERQGNGFDLVGFALVATFLGALEIALDRGLEDDWLGSNFIVGVLVVCVLAFILMIPWELSRRNPAVDVRIVATRQFSACFLVMRATGAILLSTTQYLPQLVQAEYGYTATWAGLALSPGGVVTAIMMPIVGRLSTKIQPRTLIAAGGIVCALAMLDMTRLTGDLDFRFFVMSRMLLGVGLPLIFLPILTASFDGIPRNKTDMASGLDQHGA
jgi:MFS transporter, DHA2 family, multidrug resistance protein